MENELIEKLKKALTGPIEREEQVLYIMAETRKLMEQLLKGSSVQEYPLLNFYCNWALHAEINNTSPAQKILETIEKDYKNKQFEKSRELEFVGFKYLREEIKLFLEKSGLPIDLCTVEEKWESFRKLLLDVLIDCPLKPKNGPIEEFVYKKPRNPSKNNVDWEIKFKNNDIRFHGSLTIFRI